LVNKSVLRHLIINQEKDYGWRAINNPKKVKRSVEKLKHYKETQERKAREWEQREKARAELDEMVEPKRESHE
jgi:small subunit ribosomal protein S6